jgi:hypothetical protein
VLGARRPVCFGAGAVAVGMLAAAPTSCVIVRRTVGTPSSMQHCAAEATARAAGDRVFSLPSGNHRAPERGVEPRCPAVYGFAGATESVHVI